MSRARAAAWHSSSAATSCFSISRRPDWPAVPEPSAFLVGCGWFEPGGFRVRQYFMLGHALERALLAAVRDRLDSCGALVTLQRQVVRCAPAREPVRLQPPAAGARRLPTPRHGASRTAALARGAAPCEPSGGATGKLHAVGARTGAARRPRTGDVPGFEIPTRYFAFLRIWQCVAARARSSSTTASISSRLPRSRRERSACSLRSIQRWMGRASALVSHGSSSATAVGPRRGMLPPCDRPGVALVAGGRRGCPARGAARAGAALPSHRPISRRGRALGGAHPRPPVPARADARGTRGARDSPRAPFSRSGAGPPFRGADAARGRRTSRHRAGVSRASNRKIGQSARPAALPATRRSGDSRLNDSSRQGRQP